MPQRRGPVDARRCAIERVILACQAIGGPSHDRSRATQRVDALERAEQRREHRARFTARATREQSLRQLGDPMLRVSSPRASVSIKLGI